MFHVIVSSKSRWISGLYCFSAVGWGKCITVRLKTAQPSSHTQIAHEAHVITWTTWGPCNNLDHVRPICVDLGPINSEGVRVFFFFLLSGGFLMELEWWRWRRFFPSTVLGTVALASPILKHLSLQLPCSTLHLLSNETDSHLLR